jgi:hypothetical protein
MIRKEIRFDCESRNLCQHAQARTSFALGSPGTVTKRALPGPMGHLGNRSLPKIVAQAFLSSSKEFWGIFGSVG